MLVVALLQQAGGENQDISQERSSVGAGKRDPVIAF